MDSAGPDSADADPRPVTGAALAPAILRTAPAIGGRVRWRKDGGASMSALRRILVIALVAAVVSCLFVLSYGYATHAPRPHDVRVEVVGANGAAARVNAVFDRAVPGGFDVQPAADEAAARDDVATGKAYGAIIDPPIGPVGLLTAGAGGLAVQQIVTRAATAYALVQGRGIVQNGRGAAAAVRCRRRVCLLPPARVADSRIAGVSPPLPDRAAIAGLGAIQWWSGLRGVRGRARGAGDGRGLRRADGRAGGFVRDLRAGRHGFRRDGRRVASGVRAPWDRGGRSRATHRRQPPQRGHGGDATSPRRLPPDRAGFPEQRHGASHQGSDLLWRPAFTQGAFDLVRVDRRRVSRHRHRRLAPPSAATPGGAQSSRYLCEANSQPPSVHPAPTESAGPTPDST